MKSSIKKQIPSFKPVQLSIVFETPEEVQLFGKMIMANIRIPAMLLKDNTLNTYEEKRKLKTMMSDIWKNGLQEQYLDLAGT